MPMKEDKEEVLSRYRLQFHMKHFLIRLSAGTAIMEKILWEKSYVQKKEKDKEKLTEKKEVMAKWG